MKGIINGMNFVDMEAMKYYAPPASKSKKERHALAYNRIFSGEWLAAEKKDGYFARVVKDDEGNVFMLSRSKNVNGEYPDKHEWVPHLDDFFSALPKGTCLLCECYFPNNPGSKNVTTILGCTKERAIQRQKDNKLFLYIFDILAFDGEIFINTPAKDRFEKIKIIQPFVNKYVDTAEYFYGKELWEKLQQILANGGEGMVLIHQNSPYKPGSRSTKDSLKIKKELQQTIDCFFTGYATAPTKEYSGKEIEKWPYWVNSVSDERLEEGPHYFEMTQGAPIEPVTKPYYYDWGGSLEIAVVKRDKVVPIGWLSGLADEIKANPMKYKGVCIEVSAMEIMEDSHALRHAKMIQMRPDLNYKDCTWEKVFGE